MTKNCCKVSSEQNSKEMKNCRVEDDWAYNDSESKQHPQQNGDKDTARKEKIGETRQQLKKRERKWGRYLGMR